MGVRLIPETTSLLIFHLEKWWLSGGEVMVKCVHPVAVNRHCTYSHGQCGQYRYIFRFRCHENKQKDLSWKKNKCDNCCTLVTAPFHKDLASRE